MQDDPELTAVVRSRQLHIYRNGKKALVLAGKSAPKIIREDSICELLQIERIKWMEYAKDNKPLATSVYLSLGDKEEKTKNPTMAKGFAWLINQN